MDGLPDSLEYSKVKKYLLEKQRQVEEQLRQASVDDPVLADLTEEASELGTDSWQADVHAKMVVIRSSLLDLSSKIKKSLLMLKNGTYGSCERCGGRIESARLEAFPVASLCTKCTRSNG